jgi:hypothetical protein
MLESCDNRIGRKGKAPTARLALVESRETGKGIGGQTFFYLEERCPAYGVQCISQIKTPADLFNHGEVRYRRETWRTGA